jgi:hypothetical protein
LSAVQLSSLPFLPSDLLFLQSDGAEGALCRTIINNLEQDSETASELLSTGLVQRRKVVGRIIHDYYRTSGNPAMILC